MTEKLFIRVIQAGLFATLAIPFIQLDFFVYPSVFGQALIFRLVIQILLLFYIPLILLYPAYRPNFRLNTTLGLIIYFLALVITTIFSADRAISFWGTLARDTGFVTILHFFAYYLMLISLFRRELDWKWFLRAAVISGAVMAVIIIAQSFRWITTVYGETRPYGTLGNSDFAGTYLLFSVYFTLLLFLKEKQTMFRYGALIIEILLFAALFVNATRAVLVGIGASAVVFLVSVPILKIKVRKKVYQTAVITFACGAIFIIATYMNLLPSFMYEKAQLLERIRSVSITNNMRILAWESGLRAFIERPFFGYGPENFSIAFNKKYDTRLGDMTARGSLTQFDNAHNKLVEVLATSGIIGIAAYGALLLLLARIFWRYRASRKMLTLAFLIIAYEAHLMFSLDTPNSYLLFMITLAFIHTHAHTNQKDNSRPLSKEIAAVFIIPSFILIFFSMLYTVIKPAYASSRIIAAINSNGTEHIFQNYRTALKYNSVYNHDFVRDFAEAVLSRLPFYRSEDEEMYLYIREQLEKYDNEYDWQKQFLFARIYSILCDNNKDYCALALQKLASAKRLASNRSRLYTESFVIYYKMRDYKNAQKDIERAMELGYSPEKTAPMLILIGKVYEKNQVYDKANLYYKRALVIDPSIENLTEQ